MIAAIYARKSTEQTGVADEAKSIARQIAHARAFAVRKGWTVDDAHVYVDDGISGAEFANRPAFLRMMNALKPRAPFNALIMSEESRLGRESIETAWSLKQLVTAGVRLFFYLEDRERTLDSPTDKIMLQLTAFADELERERARQRTYDALARKAKSGHVTGGRAFGYTNVRVEAGHVIRVINEPEAKIIRAIFRLRVSGLGHTMIAKRLNAEGAPTPRAQQGRPNGWCSSSIREVLYRELYRGQIVWNRTKKRDQWGQKKIRDRSADQWVRVAAPQLQIVDDALWSAAHQEMTAARAVYAKAAEGFERAKPRRGPESKYLLGGIARCGCCNGSMLVRSAKGGRERAFSYQCSAHHRKGVTACANGLQAPMDVLNAAVLSAVEADILRPSMIGEIVAGALKRLTPDTGHAAEAIAAMTREIEQVQQEVARLTSAIAEGGDMAALVDGIRIREARLVELRDTVKALKMPPVATDDVTRRIERALADWRGLARRHAPAARQALRRLRAGVRCHPRHEADGRAFYDFEIETTVGSVLECLHSKWRPHRDLSNCGTLILRAIGSIEVTRRRAA